MNPNRPSLYAFTRGAQIAAAIALLCSFSRPARAQAQTPPPAAAPDQPSAPFAPSAPPQTPATQIPTDQTQTVEVTNSPTEQTPVQLSPFEVNANDEQGYASSQALSGTRLRTDVRDLAASISIINLNFMEDLDVHNLNYLLDYTLGTEVSGLAGNFSGAGNEGNFMEFEGPMNSPNPTTRVRGLESADITRDFFPSQVPFDSYNIDRAEIDRGANAMLFGLGSPAGIINSTLITAQTNETKTKVTNEYGSYGTNRNVIDHNQVIIPGKLAVRFSTADENQYYRIKPAYDSSERLYLTSTYTPLKDTIIHVSMEAGNDNANQPENRPPWDDYTYWWKVGKPTYDPTTGLMTITANATLPGLAAAPAGTTGLPSAIYPGSGYNVIFPGISGSGGGLYQDNWAFVYSNPNSSVPSIPGYANVLGMQVFNAGEHLGNGGWQVGGTPGNGVQPDGMVGMANPSRILDFLNSGNPTANVWNYQQITDPRIFNFYDYQLDGPNKYEFSRWNTYNITLEQHFFNGHAGIEASYDRQDVFNGYNEDMGWNGYTLQIDMNTKLLNGADNPNFGRPLIYSDSYSSAGNNLNSQTDERATAYYDLDLRQVGPSWLGYILGRHLFNFTATQEWDYTESHDGGGIMNSVPYSLATGHSSPGNIDEIGSGGSRQVGVLSYSGSNMIGTSSPGNVPAILVGQYPNYTNANILYAPAPTAGQAAPSQWGILNTSLEPLSTKNMIANDQYPSKHLDRIDSNAFVMQDFLFDDTIATTFGWRNDQYKEWDAGSPNVDPNTGQLIEDPADWSLAYESSGGQPSFNYGLVGHLPDFVKRRLPLGMDLSIYYNHGDNYRPTDQRYNVFGEPIAAETGATKEYGFGISLFDGKFELRATHYKSADALNTSGSLEAPIYLLADDVDDILVSTSQGYNAGNPQGVQSFLSWMQSPAGKNFLNTFQFNLGNDVNGVPYVNSYNRRGGIVVATTDTTSTGEEYEATYNPTPYWRISFSASHADAVQDNTGADLQKLLTNVFEPLISGPAGGLFLDSTGDTYATTVLEQSIIPTQTVVAEDGTQTQELRAWHWTAVTNYSFPMHALRGWAIGGAARWMDRVAIGYPYIVDPVLGVLPDISHPYYGPTEFYVDGWLSYARRLYHNKVPWKIQLNLTDIGVGNKLIPVEAQPDGSVAAYRIAEPMKWEVSNNFTF